MSANLIVDINGTCHLGQSYPASQSQLSPSGQVCGGSGFLVGQSIDLIDANTMCQVLVGGQAVAAPGAAIFQVQVSDTDVSGLYGDPTSGLQTFPIPFQSGGLLWLNSGGTGGLYNSGFTSGQTMLSGFFVAAPFQRTQRYARINWRGDIAATSGVIIGNLTANVLSNYKQTGSGGGFSYQPSSGTVNV